MIRLRPLRPREVRSIRHWAIELAVVVVGVLLALWAAEWANDRGEKRKDAQAIEALRTELVDNLTSIGLWQAMDQCQSDQIVYLRDLLANEGREWPGIDRELLTTDIPDGQTFASIYTLWSGRPTFLAWEAAADSGAFSRLDPDERRRLQDAFVLMHNIEEDMVMVDTARRNLGGLVMPQILEPGDRSGYYSDLIRLDGARRFLNREWEKLDFGLTDGERVRLIEQLKASESLLRTNLGKVRPCLAAARPPKGIELKEGRQ